MKSRNLPRLECFLVSPVVVSTYTLRRKIMGRRRWEETWGKKGGNQGKLKAKTENRKCSGQIEKCWDSPKKGVSVAPLLRSPI